MIEYLRSKELLVDELLNKSIHKFPDKLAVIDGDRRITYAALKNRVNTLAGWFQINGIKKGEKVALLLYNSIEFVECFIALAKIGAIVIPVNFRMHKSEITYILQNSDAKMLISHFDFMQDIEEMKDKLPVLEEVVIVSDDIDASPFISYNDILKKNYSLRLEELNDNDDFLIIYTSGTTGKPKGAVLTHKNVYMNAVNMVLECGLTKDEVQIISTPLFHIGGVSALTMMMLVGGTSVLLRSFDSQYILKTIETEKVTYAFMVPSMWNMLIKVSDFKEYNVDSLRIICTAGASTPLELKKKLMASFPNAGIFDTFGHTETSGSTATLKANDALIKTGSVGLPFSIVDVRVVDEDMNDCSPNQVGEIIYRGPTMMKEYYKNPVATEDALRGGWLHSGDLVKLDEEGYVTVVDRKKDMIISGGENIYPKEIEDVLYTHPFIVEAAVIGVPHEKWGETVKAYVVLTEGVILTEQEVIDFCASKIARYKKPHSVEFIDVLPKNASGKILKTKLRNSAGLPV